MLRTADLRPDADEVGSALHTALALLSCRHFNHQCEERPCRACLCDTRPLTIPVARALLKAASFGRRIRTDVYIAAGQAVELLFHEAERK